MEKFKAFLKRKDIEISLKRYGIDALGAMAQGLFCSLLIGTIINTIGTQFHIPFLTMAVATVNDTQYTVGSLASALLDLPPTHLAEQAVLWLYCLLPLLQLRSVRQFQRKQRSISL